MKFAICIENKDCEDLEILKIYQILPDISAEQESHWRIIDESGDDYLYPQDYFSLIDVPIQVEKTLLPLFGETTKHI